MGPAHLKRWQLFVSNVWWWCQSIRTIQEWLQSLLATFECPKRTLNIFVLLIVSFLWQEHQALNEKSESPITTDDPIELTMNLYQSIQPIGNNYIFAKKGNIPCSGRNYSYIPSLTFDSQQVRHRTKYTLPLSTSCILIKEQQVLNNPYRLSPLHH